MTDLPVPTGLDAIRRELIREGLASICEEMAVSVIRTSHSETVKSAMDFSTALCDAAGEIIAQGVTLPNQLGSLPDAVAAVLAEFRGTLVPGDVLMVNDPFAGGMHLPDVFVMKPVFLGERMVAIVATVAHHADLGGMVPGSMSPYAEECYQEGLRIPPIRLYAAGTPEHGVFALLRASSRVPDLVLGDIAAQLVACDTGETGLLRLIEHHGEDVFAAQVKSLLDYTEELTRREIRALPDGTYRFTDYLDDDGVHPGPVAIAVAVTIAGDAVAFDFEGSSPQVKASLNATLSFTKSGAYCAMRSLMRSDIPNNAGFFRPITVRAPLGSIVNCVLPAATGTRGLTGFRVVDAIFGALAPAMPDRIMGGSDGGLTLVTVGGSRPDGERFSVVELVSGAWGGQAERDGQEGVPNISANVSNVPVEMLEAALPVRVERYGYVADTGGSGMHRGGLSIEREYTYLGEGVLSVRSDRRAILPYGIGAGRPGTPSANRLTSGPDELVMPSKFSRPVVAGDRFYHRTAGAGGWGDPLGRDPDAVAADVRDGVLTVQHAAAEYGVVIPPGGVVVDRAATESLRDSARAARTGPAPDPVPTALEDRMSGLDG
ncbi:MAG TPA: hydantoinase B/oxoprolinase family protein [Candidatus Limnocylindrales bacterium]|nr:hydantoinase B/oxoprolinase family protein [Candidatus Limnocylindrales bacterium]